MKKVNFNEVKILKENRFYRLSDLFSIPPKNQKTRWIEDREEILNNKEFSNILHEDAIKLKIY